MKTTRITSLIAAVAVSSTVISGIFLPQSAFAAANPDNITYEAPAVSPVEVVPADAKEITGQMTISETGIYKLSSDLSESSDRIITVAEGVDAVIYLNGHLINNTSNLASRYTIENNGNLTICGSGAENEKIVGPNGILNYGSLSLNHCTVHAKVNAIKSVGVKKEDGTVTRASVTAADSIIYSTGKSTSRSTNEFGLWNGDTVEVSETAEEPLPSDATLTNCKLGGFAGGSINKTGSTMQLYNCDRYTDFRDSSGVAGGSQTAVDSTGGKLYVQGGFETDARILGGEMEVRNVTSGKLTVAGGRDSLIENCILKELTSANAVLNGDITYKNVIVDHISYVAFRDCKLTFTDVTVTGDVHIQGYLPEDDAHAADVTMTNCTAQNVHLSDGTGADVNGCDFTSLSFANCNSKVRKPALNIGDNSNIGTLTIGSQATASYGADVAINAAKVDKVVVQEMYYKNDDGNVVKNTPMKTTFNEGAEINSYELIPTANNVLPTLDFVINGGKFGTDRFVTYNKANEKLVSYLGDYCGDGYTLVQQPDGAYAKAEGTTDKTKDDPSGILVQFNMPVKGTKSADDRLYIRAYVAGTNNEIKNMSRIDTNTEVELRVEGKYSELYRIYNEDGKRKSLFDLEYINVNGHEIPTSQMTPCDTILNKSEKDWGIIGNGSAYTYKFKISEMMNAGETAFEVVPHCTVRKTPDELFGAGNWLEVNPNEAGEYIISDAKQLNYISYLSLKYETFEGKTIKLANDIEMTGIADNGNYIPIGTYTPFRGTFDGQNHTIKNFTYYRNYVQSQYSAEYVDRVHYSNTAGIIGRAWNATIKDVNIADCTINTGWDKMPDYTNKDENGNPTMVDSIVHAIYGAILCGQSDNTTFSNINIQSSTNNGAYFGAILLGHTDGGVTIKDSKVFNNCFCDRKWDDAGLFIGYSCGTTTLERCVANDSKCGAIFIGTPNIGDHFLIDCTTTGVVDDYGRMAPIILEIYDQITHDEYKGRGHVYIQWTEKDAARLRDETDIHPADEKHDENNPMPDLVDENGTEYNDHEYRVAQEYPFTYADKMTSKCPMRYTTQKCYDADGKLLPNKLEVVFYDHYIANNELRYQTAVQGEGENAKYAIRLVSECHTLHWDYVGYRVWVNKTGQNDEEFLKNTVFTDKWQMHLDQYITNRDTANLDQSSRFVWHTLTDGNGKLLTHDHSDSYFFVRTITDIPKNIWDTATFVVQPYIIKKAASDELNEGIPNTSVKVNGDEKDEISLGAISVITAADRQKAEQITIK